MALVVGLIAGAGLILLWSWVVFPSGPARSRGPGRVRSALHRAEIYTVKPAWFVAGSLALALTVALAAAATTRAPAIGFILGVAAGFAPSAAVLARASRVARDRERVWPDAIDDMISGVRAGLSLSETLTALGERGPRPLRAHMRQFALDLRACGTMSGALDRLKDRLADPVADRIVEALRCAHSVGGGDLTATLGQLARLLRDEQRTRGELRARQSWTVNGARLASAAPWIVLLLLSTQPQTASAYRSPTGVALLVVGACVTVAAYAAMVRLGSLGSAPRTFAREEADS